MIMHSATTSLNYVHAAAATEATHDVVKANGLTFLPVNLSISS